MSTSPAPITPRWGLGDALVGWLVAETLAVLAAGIILTATGYDNPIAQAPLDLIGRVTGRVFTASVTPLALIAVLQVFLWIGLLGAPLWATITKGNGPVRDLGLRIRPVDVPLGIAVGVFCQFILVPVVSWPWVQLLGKNFSDLEKPARELSDKATDPFGILLLAIIVIAGAPVIEELFFRGLLQRSVGRHTGPVIAVAVSSLVFGLTHFQPLLFPALAAFGAVLGILAVRTGRLGPGIFAHMAFNSVTIVTLIAQR